MRFSIILLGAISLSALPAQQSTSVVQGVVYDSVARAPLAGAIVQVVLIDSAVSAPQRAFTALSDSTGHYRIEGLPSGRFAIGFQHRAVDALGIEVPLRAFASSGDSVTMNLAIPEGTAVRKLVCGAEQRLEGEGMLAGYVLDGRGENALKGAAVKARWVELALEKKNYHSVTRAVTAIVDDDGRYHACGITSDDAVRLEVTMAGYRPLTNTVTVERDGTMRQDFRLVAENISTGSNTISGRVLHSDGSIVASGRVAISALSVDVPIDGGTFSIVGLPSGTWLVETTSLGLEPVGTLVDVRDGVIATPRIAMNNRAQMLDAVSVLGRPGGSDKILKAIEARRRYANGTLFMPGNDWLAIARDPADLVRDAAGFRYINEEKVLASGCGFKDLPTERQATIAMTQKPRDRVLAIYLDGLRVVGGLPELRTVVTMRDVLAVEAYQDVATAPIEWRTYDACAVLAIWTKR